MERAERWERRAFQTEWLEQRQGQMREDAEFCWASGIGLKREYEGQWCLQGWNQVMDSSGHQAALRAGRHT